MKATKRYRRQITATIAALGVTAAVVGTAIAADQVTNINVPSDFSQPLGITGGPDGNVWFADPGAQSIGKLAPGGIPQLIPTPDAGGPAGITSGPDGNLWYTEFGTPGDPVGPPIVEPTARVSKMSTGGVVTPYPLSAPAGNLQGIASGPDGNLWVAAKGTDTLWRVTTAGVSTPFGAGLVPNAQSVARGPAGDPNIYVTTSAGISRTSTAAPAAPAQISPLSGAFGIALGPDSNFWVTHSGGVAHVTPAGGLLPGGVAVPGSDSRGIAVGPDGALWFAQFAADTVGRVTTGGDYRAIPVPGCDGPEGVASVAGSIYVSCFGANAGPGGVPPAVRGRTIVRITPDGAVTPVTPVTPVTRGGAAGAAPIAALRGGFTFNKKKVFARKVFTVNVNFNKAVSRSRVRVQIRSVNTKPKAAIKRYKNVSTKLVTGRKAALKVKIAKPGAYFLRITYVNGPRTVNVKAVKVTVKKPIVRKKR